jgi:hypothetical protein
MEVRQGVALRGPGVLALVMNGNVAYDVAARRRAEPEICVRLRVWLMVSRRPHMCVTRA